MLLYPTVKVAIVVLNEVFVALIKVNHLVLQLRHVKVFKRVRLALHNLPFVDSFPDDIKLVLSEFTELLL